MRTETNIGPLTLIEAVSKPWIRFEGKAQIDEKFEIASNKVHLDGVGP